MQRHNTDAVNVDDESKLLITTHSNIVIHITISINKITIPINAMCRLFSCTVNIGGQLDTGFFIPYLTSTNMSW